MLKKSLLRRLHVRIINTVIRLIQRIRICGFWLISTLKINGKPVLYQPLHAVGDGTLEFSGKVTIGCFPSPHLLSSYCYIEARYADAIILIGDGTWINNGFVAIAEYSYIKIGKRVLIGTNVEIINSDFHGLEITERKRTKQEQIKPVKIEDDVFVGSNVRVMKGVIIGKGAVIGNGSVITKNVPPYSVVGGNPAVHIRYLEQNN